MVTDQQMWEEARTVIEGLGYRIVDIQAKIVKGTLKVNAVVFHPNGVGLDACVDVHKTLLPRLEVLYGDRDMTVEVSSPGISRVFKNLKHEFAVFEGQAVRVLPKDQHDWISGRIAGTDGESVLLDRTGEEVRLEISNIQKAKLDDTQEARNA